MLNTQPDSADKSPASATTSSISTQPDARRADDGPAFSHYASQQLLERLRERLPQSFLERRLQREIAAEQDVDRRRGRFLSTEKWHESTGLIRAIFKASLLHGRASRNARAIQVRKNTVFLPHLPAAFDGYTMLHITDLHLDMAPDMPDTLIRAIAGLNYDLCVLTGDYRAATWGPCDAALEGLAQVHQVIRQPVFAVLGNHDSIRMLPAIEDLGIRLLMNESVALTRNDSQIWLAGIDDPHFFRVGNPQEAAQNIPADAVSVLLAHSPEIYREAAEAHFDLLLCGHTHGGQLCLPGGVPLMVNARCPRRYCKGAWRYRELRGYTGVGSGSCVVDLRLNCAPEVTLHRLCQADGE